jgi:protein kinase
LLITSKYCHLLEARADISTPGIYDSICKGTLKQKAEAVRNALAQDFSLHTIPFYTDDPESPKLLPTDQLQDENNWWGERLFQKGVPAEEIAFLAEVLNPDPNQRPSAADIMHYGILDAKKMD